MFYLELFQTLERNQVRYLLIGGLAINIYGVERATMDLDLMLALDAENLGCFLQAAKDLRLQPVLPIRLEELADPDKVRDWVENRHMLAFALRAPEANSPTLDILVNPKLDFEKAYARRVEKNLGGYKLFLASLDDLIALKTGTGRRHDEADIAALQRLRDLGLA